MEKSKQAEMVKTALELERFITNQKEDLSNLLSQQFDEKPNPPIKETIEKAYPQIEKIKINWIIVLILSISTSGIGALIYFIGLYFYNKYNKKRIEKSAKYKNECEQIDKDFNEMQMQADNLFQKQLIEYEQEILPKYHKDLEEWTIQKDQKIDETHISLEAAEYEIHRFYEETKIIPMQYQNIKPLQYIYDVISTSDYDVKHAADMYDRSEQRRLDEARLLQQQQANQLASDQNCLLQEQNEIANKARREANTAAAISTIQRHSTNKILKNNQKK